MSKELKEIKVMCSCGGKLVFPNNMIYETYPPQRDIKCLNCGKQKKMTVSDIDNEKVIFNM